MIFVFATTETEIPVANKQGLYSEWFGDIFENFFPPGIVFEYGYDQREKRI